MEYIPRAASSPSEKLPFHGAQVADRQALLKTLVPWGSMMVRLTFLSCGGSV